MNQRSLPIPKSRGGSKLLLQNHYDKFISRKLLNMIGSTSSVARNSEMNDQTAEEYNLFASIYDSMWAPEAANRFYRGLEKHHAFAEIPVGVNVLDLCCGSGRLSKRLSDDGFCVTGIDISEEMIRLVRNRAPDVDFFVEDAQNFSSDRSFHLVISTFDSINHIMTPNDLKSVTPQVSNVLREGSLFLFDLNTETKYRVKWPGSFSIEDEDPFLEVETSYDHEEQIATFHRTLFQEARNNELRERTDFTLRQRPFPKDLVQSRLSKNGFQNIKIQSLEETKNETALRQLFTAKKSK